MGLAHHHDKRDVGVLTVPVHNDDQQYKYKID
jgi:hypothetical protein